MTASNLAVCFLPSLFRVTDYQQTTARAGTAPGVNSPRRHTPRRSSSAPGAAGPAGSATTTDGYQLRYKAALACIATLIANADYLLLVRHSVTASSSSSSSSSSEADLGMFSMFGRKGAPQKGPPQEHRQIFAT